MARDLDRYRAVAWAPFLGTWLQFARAIHGSLSGELASVTASSQIVWEGIFVALGLIAYFGTHRK